MAAESASPHKCIFISDTCWAAGLKRKEQKGRWSELNMGRLKQIQIEGSAVARFLLALLPLSIIRALKSKSFRAIESICGL